MVRPTISSTALPTDFNHIVSVSDYTVAGLCTKPEAVSCITCVVLRLSTVNDAQKLLVQMKLFNNNMQSHTKVSQRLNLRRFRTMQGFREASRRKGY